MEKGLEYKRQSLKRGGGRDREEKIGTEKDRSGRGGSQAKNDYRKRPSTETGAQWI